MTDLLLVLLGMALGAVVTMLGFGGALTVRLAGHWWNRR